MEPAMIRLIVMLLDIGIDRGIEIYKLIQETGVKLPELETIKAEIEKWQPRADDIDEKISQH